MTKLTKLFLSAMGFLVMLSACGKGGADANGLSSADLCQEARTVAPIGNKFPALTAAQKAEAYAFIRKVGLLNGVVQSADFATFMNTVNAGTIGNTKTLIEAKLAGKCAGSGAMVNSSTYRSQLDGASCPVSYQKDKTTGGSYEAASGTVTTTFKTNVAGLPGTSTITGFNSVARTYGVLDKSGVQKACSVSQGSITTTDQAAVKTYLAFYSEDKTKLVIRRGFQLAHFPFEIVNDTGHYTINGDAIAYEEIHAAGLSWNDLDSEGAVIFP